MDVLNTMLKEMSFVLTDWKVSLLERMRQVPICVSGLGYDRYWVAVAGEYDFSRNPLVGEPLNSFKDCIGFSELLPEFLGLATNRFEPVRTILTDLN